MQPHRPRDLRLRHRSVECLPLGQQVRQNVLPRFAMHGLHIGLPAEAKQSAVACLPPTRNTVERGLIFVQTRSVFSADDRLPKIYPRVGMLSSFSANFLAIVSAPPFRSG